MDKVGEFLTRIRNAGTAKHEKVDVPASKLREKIAEILVKAGYIRSFKVAKDNKQGVMRVYLKYNEAGEHVVGSIQRMSTPGRRYYVPATRIPQIRSGFGTVILSTSSGLMTGDEAKSKNLGGECLCRIW